MNATAVVFTNLSEYERVTHCLNTHNTSTNKLQYIFEKQIYIIDSFISSSTLYVQKCRTLNKLQRVQNVKSITFKYIRYFKEGITAVITY